MILDIRIQMKKNKIKAIWKIYFFIKNCKTRELNFKNSIVKFKILTYK